MINPDGMENQLTILNVSGPYREPRELVFSYDYVIQRPTWPTPNGLRIKVSIAEELDYLRDKVLMVSGGSPGQQLSISRTLSRRIADCKLRIADEEGMLSARREVLVGLFSGELAHLLPKLEGWMKESQEALRQEIREKVGL